MSQALMDLKHFFAGNLSKELVASAFLATLLEARAGFRAFIFAQMGCEEAMKLAQAEWIVRVGAESVDVRLDATREGWVLLVENKISPGSMQLGQLLRYYQNQIAREPRSRAGWSTSHPT
jgi:hypothetical protein